MNWKPHTTGIQPVSDDTPVFVRFRDGLETKATRSAGNLSWRQHDDDHCIVAYRLAEEPAPGRPFDLQAALDGDPVITRGGNRVRIIAHAPDAYPNNRVIFLRDEPNSVVLACREDGLFSGEDHPDDMDLFMAPTKRTVWVNLYQTEGNDFPGLSYLHLSEEEADRAAQEGRLGGRAHPIEVEVSP